MKAAAIALLLLTLTACATPAPVDTTEQDAVTAVETAFLQALVDGDAEAAMELTTVGPTRTTCTAAITDYAELQSGIIKPSVGTVVVDGDTATADITYSMIVTSTVEEITGTHTLVRSEGEWRIELPESYRIQTVFEDGVVGQAGLMYFSTGSGVRSECVSAPVRGAWELFALPGRYEVITSDPTEVFFNSSYVTFVSVYDTDEPAEPTLLEYIQDDERDFAAAQVRDILNQRIDSCVASNLSNADCPRGIPTPEGLVSISDHLGIDGIEFYSDNGIEWRYRASGEDFLFERNGTIETSEIYYAGVVTHDPVNELYLLITVD